MNFSYRKLFMMLALFTTLFVQSCGDDPEPIKPGADGFFVVNEGAFNNGNTSISFYDRQTDAITNDIFKAVNGRDLGDQAQSMSVFEGNGYIMVQNSGKVEVIDADSYASVATITEGIESPRFFQGISATKGYVSDWGADGLTGSIKVIDLTTNVVTKTIPTGHGANKMLKVGNKVYVTNNGGYGSDNTVKIIDSGTDAVTSTITVGDNPNSIVRDSDGNIWVTSSGDLAYKPDFSIDETKSTYGTLSKINSGNTEVFRLAVDEFTYSSIGNLSISADGKTLFYTFNGNLFKMSTSATALPSSALKAKSYYGLAVNPFNGNLIGCLAPNFSSAGTIEVMDENGSVLNTHTVGIAPNGFAFK